MARWTWPVSVTPWQGQQQGQHETPLGAHAALSPSHPRQPGGDKGSAGPGRQGPGTRREEAEGPTDKKQKAGWRGPQGDHGQKQEVKRKQATNRLCPTPPAQVQGPLRSRPKTETSLPPKAPGGAHSSLLWGRVLATCYSSGSSVSSDRAVRSLPPGSAYSHPAATSAKTSTQNFGPASAEGG